MVPVLKDSLAETIRGPIEVTGDEWPIETLAPEHDALETAKFEQTAELEATNIGASTVGNGQLKPERSD